MQAFMIVFKSFSYIWPKKISISSDEADMIGSNDKSGKLLLMKLLLYNHESHLTRMTTRCVV